MEQPRVVGESGSLLAVVNNLIERGRIVAFTAVASLVITLAFALGAPKMYTAQASLIPQSRKSGASLSVIAAQLGVAGQTGDVAQSPQFYVDLARSDDILRRLVTDRYVISTRGGGGATDLVGHYGINQTDREEAVSAAINRLRTRIGAAVAVRTGVVTLRVSDESAVLASAIASKLLTALDEFNLETRRVQAESESKFTRERAKVLEAELARAEEKMKAFRLANRGDVRSSPELTLEFERLTRELQLRQQIYLSILQSHEQARIDAERDTPVITIVQAPRQPTMPDPRQLPQKAMLSAFVGIVVGVLLVLGADAAKSAGPEYERLVRNLRRLLPLR